MSPRPFYRLRSTCRLCEGGDLQKAVPLHPLPVASPNVGGSVKVTDVAPADIWLCRSCGHLQLATVVDPEFQYRNFRYLTGISLGLREHFSRLIISLIDRDDLRPGAFVIDIGSNDGSLLRFAKDAGCRVLGIDPAEQIAAAATASGIPTLATFFNVALAHEISATQGKAAVVISNNTVANIDDLAAFFDGVDAVLDEDGIVILETQYALDLFKRTLLDVVYHEHVSYFAAKPMQRFFARRGYRLIVAERIAPKGGSIRFIAERLSGSRGTEPSVATLIAEEEAAGLYDGRCFDVFNSHIGSLAEDIRRRLSVSRAQTGRALAYGASVGCAALIHYFGLGQLVDAVFDDTPLTNQIHTEQGSIPVLTGKQLSNEPPCEVLVLAWRYASPIARGHHDFRASGGRFFRALPTLDDVDGSDVSAPLA